jgi:hypothetical protein
MLIINRKQMALPTIPSIYCVQGYPEKFEVDTVMDANRIIQNNCEYYYRVYFADNKSAKQNPGWFSIPEWLFDNWLEDGTIEKWSPV